MSTVTTFIQHSIGSYSYSNQKVKGEGIPTGAHESVRREARNPQGLEKSRPQRHGKEVKLEVNLDHITQNYESHGSRRGRHRRRGSGAGGTRAPSRELTYNATFVCETNNRVHCGPRKQDAREWKRWVGLLSWLVARCCDDLHNTVAQRWPNTAAVSPSCLCLRSAEGPPASTTAPCRARLLRCLPHPSCAHPALLPSASRFSSTRAHPTPFSRAVAKDVNISCHLSIMKNSAVSAPAESSPTADLHLYPPISRGTTIPQACASHKEEMMRQQGAVLDIRRHSGTNENKKPRRERTPLPWRFLTGVQLFRGSSICRSLTHNEETLSLSPSTRPL
ncbi:uncharacterized protein LOC125754810 [Canis lupus dingo]|uniref:uncharacterized protein LOC125754810 n=1 Tax=Canis lupus dingo TaxID=286419 RepID=UPI0020C41F7C|nr:uncharacterized protein LOC125754810 [Canis lupus dingo]